MKKNIILSILILFVINLNFAQIDRTKQPESGPDPEIKFGTPKTFKLKNFDGIYAFFSYNIL